MYLKVRDFFVHSKFICWYISYKKFSLQWKCTQLQKIIWKKSPFNLKNCNYVINVRVISLFGSSFANFQQLCRHNLIQIQCIIITICLLLIYLYITNYSVILLTFQAESSEPSTPFHMMVRRMRSRFWQSSSVLSPLSLTQIFWIPRLSKAFWIVSAWVKPELTRFSLDEVTETFKSIALSLIENEDVEAVMEDDLWPTAVKSSTLVLELLLTDLDFSSSELLISSNVLDR